MKYIWRELRRQSSPDLLPWQYVSKRAYMNIGLKKLQRVSPFNAPATLITLLHGTHRSRNMLCQPFSSYKALSSTISVDETIGPRDAACNLPRSF